jgi:prepilin-type processing-associated H-X9-DG protein
MSNIKQIMLATQMYAADHDQHLPSALDWPQALLPIVKNAQVYICDNDDSSGFPAGGDMRSSYTMSKALSGVDPRFIRDPGQVGVLFDGNALFGGTSVAAFRHNDGLHVGFADGHVKWVSQGNFAQVPLSPAAAGQPRPGP